VYQVDAVRLEGGLGSRFLCLGFGMHGTRRCRCDDILTDQRPRVPRRWTDQSPRMRRTRQDDDRLEGGGVATAELCGGGGRVDSGERRARNPHLAVEFPCQVEDGARHWADGRPH
jgi:hypothetical protein